MLFFVAGEGFLEIRKAGPGVSFWCAVRSDAPEVEKLLFFSLRIQNELNREDTGGVKCSSLLGLGALEVVSGGVVVKN